jgi:hypothetical protein
MDEFTAKWAIRGGTWSEKYVTGGRKGERLALKRMSCLQNHSLSLSLSASSSAMMLLPCHRPN